MSSSFCDVFKINGGEQLTPSLIYPYLPDGEFGRILIKPNWVKHQESPHFPIDALVTNHTVIDAVIQACLEKYKSLKYLTIGDVPLQTCEWDLLLQQARIQLLIEKYENYREPRIQFLDLRRERFNSSNGFLVEDKGGKFGDPRGYKEVVLDKRSFLDSISDGKNKFRVSDYSPTDMTISHSSGRHRYLIAGSALDCDLFINLPKMKTHQKTGVTGALKNLVGINGQKAYLVHFRKGTSVRGGDEFPPTIPLAIVVQVRVRDYFQKKSRVVFAVLRKGWNVLKGIYGIEVIGTAQNLDKKFYVAAGSWYGNDTIWRMVYDLNKIILYAPREGGALRETPQRSYLAILDGIIAGEGNGPLQPLPVAAGLIGIADDPFLMDIVMAQLMGFDYSKIPLLKNYTQFRDSLFASFQTNQASVQFDGKRYNDVSALPTIHKFIPSPGWRGHIEMEDN